MAGEIQTLRTQFPKHPIAVGFGISTVEQARTVAQFADGVVVGSLLVKAMETDGVDTLQVLAGQFADAVHHV